MIDARAAQLTDSAGPPQTTPTPEITSTPTTCEETATHPWRIAVAVPADVPAVVAAVAALLRELGGEPPPEDRVSDAIRAIVGSPAAGLILVAKVDEAVVGILAASWQIAIHVPGRYGLVQDLWVDPAWRSRAVGAGLVDAFAERARWESVERIEVGLPRESFQGFPATQAFYLRNGFETLGPRMRRRIP